MIYETYQASADMMWPLKMFAKEAGTKLNNTRYGLTEMAPVRNLAAAYDVFALADLTQRRPPFAIDSVMVGDEQITVQEEVAHQTPFGTLLRFKKNVASPQPKVLIVAPMSGHFATLLRETVRTMLADHDVYITDWHNANSVPLMAGRFGLDEYTEHLMTFLGVMGPGSHLMAICQPCVSALTAVAIMSEDNNPATPLSLTLMAGPIDCRISPTEVNKLATTKPIEWFEKNLVCRVPLRYMGAMRRVYPGFLQLSAFLNMNLQRHITSFQDYFSDLVKGDFEKANSTRNFYEEYFAVSDLHGEFYLETVQHVFQEYALPQGKLMWRGRKVNPAAIRRTALLTVEGERDDICAIGQTLAAQDLCTGLREYMRTHYIQAGAGHYGVFSGKRWNNHIYPVVREVIHVSQ